MLYLARDREINISLFFCDVFVWKWGPRPRTSSRCYHHGNKSAATFKKGIFVRPTWVPNCLQNLKGGWKFSFPKMFDSYRDSFLKGFSSSSGCTSWSNTHCLSPFFRKNEKRMYRDAWRLHGIWYMLHVILDLVFSGWGAYIATKASALLLLLFKCAHLVGLCVM